MDALDTDQRPTPEKLVAAVRAIAGERGMAPVSSRAIAERAGVAASAINYAFGSLEALVGAARAAGDAMRAQAWSACARELGALPCGPGDLGPVIFATTRQIAVQQSHDEALFWSEIIEAARMGQPVTANAGLARERAYWSALLEACGLGHVDATLVQAFSLSIRFAYRMFPAPERFDPWALALVGRFAARLSGAPCETASDSAHRQRAQELANLSGKALVPDHETARRILETAVETILDQGPEAASFRTVARRAGLSVSSVQHFFGSRRAYLLAAFTTIYGTVRNRTVEQIPAPGSLTPSALAHLLSHPGGPATAFPTREFAAMQGLMLSASGQPETRILAEGLFAQIGQTSLDLLQALASPRGRISRLDAQLFSLSLTHLLTLDVAQSPGAPPDTSRLTEELITLLFT